MNGPPPPRFLQPVFAAFSREEIAWLEMTAADNNTTIGETVASIVREVIRDDVAEERKTAS